MKNGVEDFVVESTPVLDLKKQGLPSSSASSAASSPVSERAWDADRTEVYTDADGDSSVASLIGEHGEVYPITTFPFVMGRGAECDLVLQGKGVSRRHAEIIFQAGRFVVNDLESLNGIKVNGYKVSRVILEEDDSIKLGEVALSFRSKDGGSGAGSNTEPAKARSKGLFSRKTVQKSDSAALEDDTFGPSPIKKLLVNVALVVVAAMLSVAGYQFWRAQSPKGAIIVQPPQSSQQANVQDQVVTKEQNVPEVPAAAASVVQEQPAEVPAAKAIDSQPDVSPSIADSGVAPPPSLAPPPSIASAAPAKAQSVTAKPAAAAPKQSAAQSAPKAERPAAVKPAPAIKTDQVRATLANAQELYLGGSAPKAIAALKSLLDDRAVSGAIRSEVQDAYAKYTSLFDQYSAGQASYVKGDKEAAFESWVGFMDKESVALSGRKSSYTRNISSRVVSEYVALGTEASRNGEHHKAYRFWQKALGIEDNVAARIAIDNANNRAMQLYRQALRLEYVNTSKAKALWMEVTELLPPGTEYHTKASAKLAWYEKWGT